MSIVCFSFFPSNHNDKYFGSFLTKQPKMYTTFGNFIICTLIAFQLHFVLNPIFLYKMIFATVCSISCHSVAQKSVSIYSSTLQWNSFAWKIQVAILLRKKLAQVIENEFRSPICFLQILRMPKMLQSN